MQIFNKCRNRKYRLTDVIGMNIDNSKAERFSTYFFFTSDIISILTF